MILFRICQTKYVNSPMGQGCLAGRARWNNKGVLIGYTSENESTAMLEVLSGLQDLSFLKLNYSVITLELDDSIIKKDIDFDVELDDWLDRNQSRQFTSDWSQGLIYPEYAGIIIPSIVVPYSKNCIINLQFKGIENHIKKLDAQPLRWDSRLIAFGE